MNICGVFRRSGWLVGHMSYYLPLTLPSFFGCFSLWAPDSQAQMSFNIWEAPDGTIRAVITADILRRSMWFGTLINCWLLRLLSGAWIERLGCMITFKWHPPRLFSFELVIFQVSLPWQQLCSWGRQPGSLPLRFPRGGFGKPPPEGCRLKFASLFPISGGRGPFVCHLRVCSLDAPLNVFFVWFFPYCRVN